VTSLQDIYELMEKSQEITSLIHKHYTKLIDPKYTSNVNGIRELLDLTYGNLIRVDKQIWDDNHPKPRCDSVKKDGE